MDTGLGMFDGGVDTLSRLAVQQLATRMPADLEGRAKLAVCEARTFLAGVLKQHASKRGDAPTEADGLIEMVLREADMMAHEQGYTAAQALAVKLGELSRFQVVVEMAGDEPMLENVRRVKAHMIQALGTPGMLADQQRVG